MQYTWQKIQYPDIESMLKLSESNSSHEISHIMPPNYTTCGRNLTFAYLTQHYSPTSELLMCAKDSKNKLLAYTWASGTNKLPWTDERKVDVIMTDVDFNLSTRIRVQLVKDMMNLWEDFAKLSKTNIIISGTSRVNQNAYLKLHSRNGYEVRGSWAIKRLNTTQATPAN